MSTLTPAVINASSVSSLVSRWATEDMASIDRDSINLYLVAADRVMPEFQPYAVAMRADWTKVSDKRDPSKFSAKSMHNFCKETKGWAINPDNEGSWRAFTILFGLATLGHSDEAFMLYLQKSAGAKKNIDAYVRWLSTDLPCYVTKDGSLTKDGKPTTAGAKVLKARKDEADAAAKLAKAGAKVRKVNLSNTDMVTDVRSAIKDDTDYGFEILCRAHDLSASFAALSDDVRKAAMARFEAAVIAKAATVA
jgi:hypothetical protein